MDTPLLTDIYDNDPRWKLVCEVNGNKVYRQVEGNIWSHIGPAQTPTMIEYLTNEGFLEGEDWIFLT